MEFDKLKEIVSAECFSILGREGIIAMTPIMDRQSRIERIGLVSDFRALLNSSLSFPTPHDRDIRPLFRKLKEGAYHLTVAELVDAAETIKEYKNVAHFIRKQGSERLKRLVDATSGLPELQAEVRRMIDENGEVRDNATKELKSIRQDFRRAHKLLLSSAERLISEKKRLLQEELFTTREERIVLPVLMTEKKKVPGIVHGMSQTQSTVFIEPIELVELNNENATFRLREEQEIKRILRGLTEILINDLETCDHALDEMKEVDVLYGIASFSDHNGFSEPHFAESRIISIRGGRHPLLIVKRGKGKVIPFDVQLGKGENLLLVSGPNMGGKTVLLKSIGIITIMAYAGMHIPAQPDSMIPDIHTIYADIGDEQSIEMDLSTFSSHIRHISTALHRADEHSLVLLDEIGVGTDPEEGMGIAMAALESLAEKGALTFATTHYGKLKHFVAGNRRMGNASMEFDLSHGIPTYHLSLGIPGSSHGLAIAEKEGFPKKLLERARSFLDENALKTEELLVELEHLRKESESIKNEVSEQKDRYEELRKAYEQKYDELKQKEETFIKDARSRAQDMVIQTRQEMEQIVRKIRESQASRASIKESKSTIERKLQSLEEEEVPLRDQSFAVGDYVFSRRLKLAGTVVDVLEGYAKVESRNVRFLAPLETLELREKRSKEIPSQEAGMEAEAVTELDIRGLLVEEAQAAVTNFIDHAVLSNLDAVRIIHGKGTGALREAVGELLRGDRRVKDFRLGYHTEGGSGVTIVELTTE